MDGSRHSPAEMMASSDRVLGIMLAPQAAAAHVDSEPISEGILLMKLSLKTQSSV